MLTKRITTSIGRLCQRFNRQTVDYDLNSYNQILYEIKRCGAPFQKRTDDQLKEISVRLSLSANWPVLLLYLLIEKFKKNQAG